MVVDRKDERTTTAARSENGTKGLPMPACASTKLRPGREEEKEEEEVTAANPETAGLTLLSKKVASAIGSHKHQDHVIWPFIYVTR